MASTPLTEAITATSADTARATTAVLRQATFLRMNGTKGVVELAGGEVDVNLNGLTPDPGDVLSLLQQGYDLLAIGPVSSVPAEVVIATTAPTDPGVKLWMKV